MPTTWRQISATDTAYCQRFVALTQAIDPRYRAFNVGQLQQWLAGTSGPYVGDTVAAFGGFPRPEDIAFPGRMQATLLLRFHPGDSNAEVMMLGWAPASTECQPSLLDVVIDDMSQQAASWLATLTSPSPIKTVSVMVPKMTENQQVQRLYDRFYARATAYAPLVPGQFLQLVRERQMSTATYWELQIVM